MTRPRGARVLPAALAAVAAVAVPAGAATGDSTYEGGCGYTLVTDDTWLAGERGHYVGAFDASAVLSSPSEPARPVTGTLTCELSVDGVLAETASFTGTRVIAGVEPLELRLAEDDAVELCETMVYADDTPPYRVCYAAVDLPLPQPVYDFAHFLTDTVPGGTETICAVLAQWFPDVGRVARTEPNGDLMVLGTNHYDCPPRGWPHGRR